MIQVTPAIQIAPSEIQLVFVRASGPGGQNVNKVASAVQLYYDVRGSPLEPDVKQRLLRLAGRRVTEEGVLIIEAKRYRNQERNREDAVQRLVRLIRKALEQPPARRATRPSRAAKAVRVDQKTHRGRLKRARRRVPDDRY